MNTRRIRAATAAASAIILAGLAVPAAATQGAAVQSGQQAGTASRPAANPDQRICVRLETTGSRVAPLVCRTRAEWQRSGDLDLTS